MRERDERNFLLETYTSKGGVERVKTTVHFCTEVHCGRPIRWAKGLCYDCCRLRRSQRAAA